MLDRALAQDVPSKNRRQYLNDSCDKTEEVQYNKPFSPDELTEKRVELENVSIDISDLNQQKKDYMDSFKIEMDPLAKTHAKIVKDLKNKTVQVTEVCYAFLDEDSRMVGYYNGDGILVYSRPASATEMQRTVQMEIRRTGTNG